MISYNAIRKNKTLSQVLSTGEASGAESEGKTAAAVAPAEKDKKD